jgi:hypothetical protein
MAKKTSTGVLAAEVGAGLAAAAAAAGAGYYFYMSDDAKKHRKIAARWANGLKKDVLKEAKAVGKELDAATVAAAVDRALGAYQQVRSINRDDLNRAGKELKKNWRMIQQEALSQGRQGMARGKKVAKKVASSAKKATKKPAPKANSKKSRR